MEMLFYIYIIPFDFLECHFISFLCDDAKWNLAVSIALNKYFVEVYGCDKAILAINAAFMLWNST